MLFFLYSKFYSQDYSCIDPPDIRNLPDCQKISCLLFRNEHASVAKVQFIPFTYDDFVWLQHMLCYHGHADDALWLVILSRMRYDHGCVDSGDTLVFSFLAEVTFPWLGRCGVVAIAHHWGNQLIVCFFVTNLCAPHCGEGIIPC
jgi:hypothetical protein